ncbi:MAG TPA: M56 family metallopeptidase [Vicinamibacterales bacterium]|nr:M56 family metallopeptidase [Vicinamibacterales bacterium]
MDDLLNWMVQGLLVALAAAAGLRVMPASPAAARYGFIWAASLLVLALPAFPLVPMDAIDVSAVALASITADPVLTVPAAWWTSHAVLTILLIVWSSVHGVQLVAGAVALHRARRQSRPCPRDVLTRLPHWSRVSATGRSTRVVLSNHVRFAAVLGCGRPIIALAPGIVEQLSAADLDRVLVHEWAHVQRRDDVTQFAQRIVRAIVGWHPAAWWLERQADFEREAACDEIAVAVTGSPKRYAACLATLAALPQAAVHSPPALAAVTSSGLRRRFVRILALPSVGAAPPRRAATVGAAAALAALALPVANVRAVASAPTWTTLPPIARPVFTEVAAAIGVHTTSVSVVPAASRQSQVAPPAPRPNQHTEPAGRGRDESPDRAAPATIEPPPTPTIPSVPLSSLEWIQGATVSTEIAPSTQAAVGLDSAPSPASTPTRVAENAPALWTVAADAGVAVGRSSQNAGLAAAGFFTRFGTKIARSF